MKKAFDRVPRKVLWWVLRSVGVEEWAIHVIQGIYANGCSRVRVNGSYSSSFQVGDGVHQGLVLSPLLFILVLEALSREFRNVIPWELLYADDLVIADDALNVCISKACTWVNMKKTKILISGIDLDLLEKSGKFPCGVCLKVVGVNSILCSTCNLWICEKYSGITKTHFLYVFSVREVHNQLMVVLLPLYWLMV